MLLYLIATCFLALTTAYSIPEGPFLGASSDVEELSWSDTYTVKVHRVSISHNIEEDFIAWKTNTSSRIDCNNGAVKVIENLVSDEYDTHLEIYMIHPETTESELNAIKCRATTDKLFTPTSDLDEILPPINGRNYTAVGTETVGDGIDATKFKNDYYDEEHGLDIKNTIWATYDNDFGWVPVKFEIKKYNDVLASLLRHEIWTFFSYRTEVDDESVFDLEENGCELEKVVKHTADSEKVTKELFFINPDNNKHVDHVFGHFKNKFNKQYKEQREHALRKALFREKMRMIIAVNKQNLTYKLGVNEFSDWTPEEKKRLIGIHANLMDKQTPLGTVQPFPYSDHELQSEVDKLPEEYDMRVEGIISPIKSQDACGSCWTFAGAAVAEGALAKTNGGRVLSLSNQAIIDCAYDDLGDRGAGGCQGGFDYVAYNFMERHGLPTEQEYGPYKMRDDYCKIYNMSKTYKIKGYTPVTKYSASAMKVAMFKHGPLFIYINGGGMFGDYSSGIFYQSEYKCDPEMPTHAVAAVGYGETDGEPYFILKNSYGEYWGEDGYMRISARDNVCGVASNPSYPVF